MSFDFTTIIDRHGHDSMAVDSLGSFDWTPSAPKEGFDSIPLWIADMGFATAPAVTESLRRRIEHPVFGYYEPGHEYYERIISWHARRNGVSGMEPRHIGYENGVLGGVLSALGVLCSRGNKVLVHSPTYIGFTHAVGGAGYDLVHSPLVLEDGVWRMDFEDMERRIVDNDIHAAIFCSPHNPCGRVWERAEIERAMEVFERHDVWVVSDEIWSDLVYEPAKHVPTQSVSAWAKEHTVALYAPSKTFNLAGLVGSYHVIYNDWLRSRVVREGSLSHYNAQSVLSMHALMGGYSSEGEAWLDELRPVLASNISLVCEHAWSTWPGVQVARAEGTYVLLLDCREWCREHGVDNETLVQRGWDVGVTWHDGRLFDCPWCVRLNVAVPRSQVEEAIERMDRYVFCASSSQRQQQAAAIGPEHSEEPTAMETMGLLQATFTKKAEVIEDRRRAFLTDPEDIETIHRFRTNARTLRSFVAFIKPWQDARQNAETQVILRDVVRHTSRLRELDVLEKQVRANPDSSSKLIAFCCKEASTERAAVLKTLSSKKVTSQFERAMSLAKAIKWKKRYAESGLPASVVRTRFDAMVESVRADLDTVQLADDEQTHDVRKRAKRIRYVAEHNGAILGADAAAIAKEMNDHQDTLGEVCDARANIRLIGEFLQRDLPKSVKRDLMRMQADNEAFLRKALKA